MTSDSMDKVESTKSTGTAETMSFNDDSSGTVNVEDINLDEVEDGDDSPIPLSQNTHRPQYVKDEDKGSSHDVSDPEFDWSQLKAGTKIPRYILHIFTIN